MIGTRKIMARLLTFPRLIIVVALLLCIVYFYNHDHLFNGNNKDQRNKATSIMDIVHQEAKRMELDAKIKEAKAKIKDSSQPKNPPDISASINMPKTKTSVPKKQPPNLDKYSLKDFIIPRRITFLDKKFCNPPWYGYNCARNNNQPCSSTSDLCVYNDEVGTISIPCERWRGAQKAEQGFWDPSTGSSDRNEGHEKSFDYYTPLPQHLGDVIELGSGPFTQSQTIFKTKNASSITLVEPMAFHYITSVQGCTYKDGTLKDLPTTVLSIPAEEIKKGRKFDTLVMINVIEHVYDALSIMNSAVNLIKDGGLFIWHERFWSGFKTAKVFSEKDEGFQLHPIRIKKPIVDQLLLVFDEIFYTNDTEALKVWPVPGVYFIGKRRSGEFETKIPKHQPCFKQKPGQQSVVFFVSQGNSTAVFEQLQIAATSSNVKLVILVLTEAMTHESLSELLDFNEVKATISYHHLSDWKTQIGYYITPCDEIVSTLSPDMLNGDDTICIGSN